ncbi:hypothetical protein [Legionella nagasakiensis]|uniref:hypothetical protein n=1 Tax=Legionella nagasakiensis TaxID=535290 RepID=UPI001A93FE02|nr:hypothetical protein [Legionella nagasakiensis]
MNYNLLTQLQIVLVLLGAPFFAFLDSPWLEQYFPHGQDITNVIMISFYSWTFLTAKRRLHWLVLLMTITSLCAEIMGSKILILYEYHLKNIPIYIPLGHAVIYATVFQISRQPLVWQHHVAIEKFLHKFAFITCFMSLFILKDVAGFMCYMVFLVIMSQRTKPLFYLCMFAVTYYIELCGTTLAAWSYYFVLGNHPNYPPTSITPSGIAGVYIIVDLTCNSAYFYIKKFKKYFKNLGNTPTSTIKKTDASLWPMQAPLTEKINN